MIGRTKQMPTQPFQARWEIRLAIRAKDGEEPTSDSDKKQRKDGTGSVAILHHRITLLRRFMKIRCDPKLRLAVFCEGDFLPQRYPLVSVVTPWQFKQEVRSGI